MNRRLATACLLGSLILPSCRVVQQRPDLGWFRDVLTAPQNDSVVVEEGRGLPEPAAPARPAAATPTRPIAATQPVIAQAPAPQAAAPQAVRPTPPAVQAPSRIALSGKKHTVAKGDTLAAIARRYKCDMQTLAAANGISDPRALKLGAVLDIPAPGAKAPAAVQVPAPAVPAVAAAPAARRTARTARKWWRFWEQKSAPVQLARYTVQPGDTLGSIARRHGVTLQAVMSANGMTMQQANNLRVGQSIVIPGPAKH